MTENPPIEELLKQYPCTEDKKENLKLAKQVIADHYKDATKADALEVINFHLKDHLKLDTNGVKVVTAYWKSFNDAEKAEKAKVEKTEKEASKEAKADKEDEEKKLERERIRKANALIREKRQNRIDELYDVLSNKNGTSTVTDIENAKVELKEKMMDTFWGVEGRNLKTGNPGHLSLKKLAIADYVQKAFNIVRFGGRLWWYDWTKAFYTYDADDVYINREVTDIMKAVGDGEDYVYNGKSKADKADIIDIASNTRVYTDNPFNKHTGYINAKNGVLKIDYDNRKVTLIGKKPDYMFSYCIDTVYDPTAKDTAIHEMLRENVGASQRELIYQMAAIAIRDTDPKLIPSKIAYLFIGPRNTGKNVVMQALNDFFGNAIVSRIPLIEVANNKFVKPLLEGKVINLDDELPEHLPLTESREIKSLTGGKFHTIEPKNVKPYSGIITALLVFAGNQYPKCTISKNEDAFWDRWEIINFDKKRHEVNEDYLRDVLTPHNLSGFFNRVIQKLFDIHKNKITRQRTTEGTYNKWMHESNSVYQFLQAMTIPTTEVQTIEKSLFHDYYLRWCDEAEIVDIDRCKTLEEFGRDLRMLEKVKDHHPRFGDTRPSHYKIMRRYEPTLPAKEIDIPDDIGFYVVPEHVPEEEREPPIECWYEDEYGNTKMQYIYEN